MVSVNRAEGLPAIDAGPAHVQEPAVIAEPEIDRAPGVRTEDQAGSRPGIAGDAEITGDDVRRSGRHDADRQPALHGNLRHGGHGAVTAGGDQHIGALGEITDFGERRATAPGVAHPDIDIRGRRAAERRERRPDGGHVLRDVSLGRRVGDDQRQFSARLRTRLLGTHRVVHP